MTPRQKVILKESSDLAFGTFSFKVNVTCPPTNVSSCVYRCHTDIVLIYVDASDSDS